MKKWFIGILIFLLLFSFGCPEEKPESPWLEPDESFLLYDSFEGKFKLKYPSDWSIEGTSSQAGIVFRAPDKDSKIIVKSITLFEVYSSITIEEYNEIVVSDLSKNPEIKKIDSKETTLNEEPAIRLIYVIESEEKNTEVLAVLMIKNERVYSIEFIALKEEFKSNLENAAKIIGSFETAYLR